MNQPVLLGRSFAHANSMPTAEHLFVAVSRVFGCSGATFGTKYGPSVAVFDVIACLVGVHVPLRIAPRRSDSLGIFEFVRSLFNGFSDDVLALAGDS